jgi:hypothetical protein
MRPSPDLANENPPCHDPNDTLATPLRVEAAYDAAPGSITMVTIPPLAGVITPAWTAAGHTGESSV